MDEMKALSPVPPAELCRFCWQGGTWYFQGKVRVFRQVYLYPDGGIYHKDCRPRADEILAEK